jgi:hypothetical protein
VGTEAAAVIPPIRREPDESAANPSNCFAYGFGIQIEQVFDKGVWMNGPDAVGV